MLSEVDFPSAFLVGKDRRSVSTELFMPSNKENRFPGRGEPGAVFFVRLGMHGGLTMPERSVFLSEFRFGGIGRNVC